MKKILLTLSALACAAGTLCSAAADKDFYVTMEGFGGAADANIIKGFKKVSIGGFWSTAGTTVDLDSDLLSLDLAGILSIGGGSEEEDELTATTYRGDKFSQADVFGGLQVGLQFNLTETVHLTAGLMGGVDVRSARLESKGNVGGVPWDVDKTDSDIGVFYGAYLRVDTRLTDRWSLTASGRWMGTTAENDFKVAGATVETEKVNYAVITVGVRFAF
ncbi:MAG: TonB-dependent receptor [Opitutales bacterium]|nr:TonB-dependent receptor [Opitutales bacterium]